MLGIAMHVVGVDCAIDSRDGQGAWGECIVADRSAGQLLISSRLARPPHAVVTESLRASPAWEKEERLTGGAVSDRRATEERLTGGAVSDRKATEERLTGGAVSDI
ncbi:MAG: hypothetical protein KDA51_09590, partial [Planctomycetales bacterium]|nr:hypothetical protein [Planctomycetales bacterium]